MRLNSSFFWPLGAHTKIIASIIDKQGCTTILKTGEVKSSDWKAIKEQNKVEMDQIKVEYEYFRSNWFWIYLDPFTIDKKSSVTFEFNDTENSSWKDGMEWDTIQLNKIG